MDKYEWIDERLKKARVFITSHSDEYTEMQVAIYRAIKACLAIDMVAEASSLMFVLESVNEGLFHNPGPAAIEIKKRGLMMIDGQEPPDHWDLL